jgi:TRAP-type C4-dicarboxylate transport system permease small subunit
MKNSAMLWVGITTILLVLVTCMATLNFAFSWVFYLTVIGQVAVLIMVYKVLTDNYKTDKTFEDFYEDYPIGKDSNFR